MTEARYKEAVSHKTLSLKPLSVGSFLWQINAVVQKGGGGGGNLFFQKKKKRVLKLVIS